MFRKQHPQAGSRPGTLIVAEDALPTRVRVTTIQANNVEDRHDVSVDDLGEVRDESSVTWVSVQGFADIDALLAIAERFSIHPLVLEDLANLPQRPKHDVYDSHAVIIGQASSDDPSQSLGDSQVSMIVGDSFVITFQKTYSELFHPVRDRLRRPGARLRTYGSGYLAYALFDTMVDSFYPIISRFGERLEALEDQVLRAPRPELLSEMSAMKRELLQLRWTSWAQRDTVTSILHDDERFGIDTIRIFLRDTLDHCTQIAEVLDMYRETLSGLLNFYLSSVGQRTNEIMKTLTIMASIFIPLTFLAGIYGMNFENMPELGTWWGYPAVWGTMAAIVVGMLFYFRAKGWIGATDWTHLESSRETQTSTAHTVAVDYREENRMSSGKRAA